MARMDSLIWRIGALASVMLAYGNSTLASEPVNISLDGKTVTPTSVANELIYFMGDDAPLLNLREIEKRGGYYSGNARHDAWSDSYWPHIQGGVAAPFADSNALGAFLLLGNLTVDRNRELFFRTHGALWSNPSSLTNEQIEIMSPTEKYDLLVGDEDFGLTRRVWDNVTYLNHYINKVNEAGQFVIDEDGAYVYEKRPFAITPFWYGICNGWAAAAIRLERPLHSFTLTNARGQKIKFFPTDVQALASQLWARSFINSAMDGSGPDAKPVIRHSGHRCNEKRIGYNLLEGRATNPACNDVNPGVWHLAVINLIGVAKESFIVDTRTADSVWNHPIKSYWFRYFNVFTGDYGFYEKAKVRAEDVRDFKKYRSPRARYIVGVEMEVEFINNIDAKVRETFSSADDKKGYDTYTYDLELDENDNVVGGEWRLNGRPDIFRQIGDDYSRMLTKTSGNLEHPDFIWHPLPGWKAFAIGDRLMGVDYGTWDGNGAVPEGIRAGAKKSSAQEQPLAEIVDLLISHSRK